MKRVIVHWTAGTYKVSALDKQHYHGIVDGNGLRVLGNHPISANRPPLKPGKYAAHTLNCNSHSIGLAAACMHKAEEKPFKAGKYPLNEKQWNELVAWTAQHCITYNIPVTPKTVLTHAEVQANLGIKQRGKWDITRLPFDAKVQGAKAVGDKLRAEVRNIVMHSRDNVVPIHKHTGIKFPEPIGQGEPRPANPAPKPKVTFWDWFTKWWR